MADAEVSYGIILEDGISGPSQAAASALEALRTSVQADQSELKQLNSALRALRGDAAGSKDEITALKAKIDAKKQAVAAATREMVKYGNSFTQIKSPAAGASGSLQSLQRISSALPESFGGATTAAKKLTAIIGSAGAAGLAGVAVVAAALLTTLGTAIVGLTAKLFSLAVKFGDAAREQTILLRGIVGSEAASKQLAATIDAVAAKTALSSSKVHQLGADLARAGLRGRDLQVALEAASMASAVGGSEAERAFMDSAKAAAAAGGSVDELARKIRNQFGDAAKAQMLGFRVQVEKAREGTARMFASVNIEPFLAGLSKITGLLNAGSSAGKAMGKLLKLALDPLMVLFEKLAPVASAFFRGILAGALLLTIGILKVRNAFKDVIPAGVLENINLIKVAFYAGIVVAGILAAVLLAAAVAMGILATTTIIAMIPLMLLVAAVVLVIAIFVALGVAAALVVAKIVKAFRALTEIDLAQAGRDLMSGLLSGITSGVGAVVAAVKKLANSIKATITNALGIASPSKVFLEYGLNTTGGMAAGIERGSPDVADAVSEMVPLPDADSPALPPAQGSAPSTPTNVTINVYAPSGDALDIADEIRRVVTDLFEGVSISMGGFEVPA